MLKRNESPMNDLMLRLPRATLVLLTLATVTLSACGDSTKRAFGITRTSPDEFSVAPRAPLSQPPDFKLRPPRPGAEDLTKLSAQGQARQAVFRGDEADRKPRVSMNTLRGNDGPATQAAPRELVSRLSTGESAFLSLAGALETDPLIRFQIDRESAVLVEESEDFVRSLLGLERSSPAAVVDAPAETRRLREAEALGTSPFGDGNTPTIERKGNSLFKVF